MASRAVVVGCLVATVAFGAYSKTLLPGVDLGDTGGFQASVLWPETSARQAYPLYYALAGAFVGAVAPGNPARGANLFSAVCAAAASGLLGGVTSYVTGAAAGGAAAGLLLAFSYTFWTQAVIAEVYALHLALVGACLAALAAWWRRPSTPRLALFFAIYALGFGNHLSMILLVVPFAAFILGAAERRADVMPLRIAFLALGIALAGALQYLPQLQAVWLSIDAPERWTDRLAAFWFDVTKSDWRESMVLRIPRAQIPGRVAMLAFDARQQFGVAGLALAAAGVPLLWRRSRPWAVLLVLAYLVNTLFALTYNVGDPHVFFLPGHYFVAFAAGAAVAGVSQSMPSTPARAASHLLVLAALLYAGWRGYDTWPAVDRSADRRAERLVNRITAGLDDRHALLAAQLNWQVENAVLYETRYRLRHVTWLRLDDVLLHFPLIVRDNHASGRDVVLTAEAAQRVTAAFGPLFPLVPDLLPPAPSLLASASAIPPGTTFVLALLSPTRDDTLDAAELADAVAVLTGGRSRPRQTEAYEIVVGRAGEPPLLHRSAARPFRERLRLPEGALEIRIDGWVPHETFRRGGFGHVALDRRPVMTIERGIGLATLEPGDTFYAAGVYALKPRFRIPMNGLPELALLH